MNLHPSIILITVTIAAANVLFIRRTLLIAVPTVDLFDSATLQECHLTSETIFVWLGDLILIALLFSIESGNIINFELKGA
jgi:hypothetical protein